MTENTNNKKRIALHIIIAAIFNYGLRMLSDAATSVVLINYIPENLIYKYNQPVIYTARLITAVLTVMTYFIIGRLLTKDKSKSVIFAGSLYFGTQVTLIASSLLGCVTDFLFNYGSITGPTRANLLLAIDIIVIPLFIFASYFFFTALEGINTKFKSSLTDTEITLKRARLRFLTYSVIGSVVIGAVTSAPNLIFYFLRTDNTLLTTITNDIVEWLSHILTVLLFVLMGYKVSKNLVDTIAFGACSGIAGAFSNIILLAVNIPSSLATSHVNELIRNGAENVAALSASLSVINLATTITAAVPALIISLVMLRYFFPEAKITLFTDNASCKECNECE